MVRIAVSKRNEGTVTRVMWYPYPGDNPLAMHCRWKPTKCYLLSRGGFSQPQEFSIMFLHEGDCRNNSPVLAYPGTGLPDWGHTRATCARRRLLQIVICFANLAIFIQLLMKESKIALVMSTFLGLWTGAGTGR
eukprot:scaffold561_cov162-Amphora_coffeaeformis.AAC.6